MEDNTESDWDVQPRQEVEILRLKQLRLSHEEEEDERSLAKGYVWNETKGNTDGQWTAEHINTNGSFHGKKKK